MPYKTVYTQFGAALQTITTPKAGPMEQFLNELQIKLDEELENNYPSDAPTLADIIRQ